MKHLSIALCSILFAGLASACSSSSEESGPTINIGAVLDKTGSIASPSWTDAVNLAAKHANSGLETAGRPFRFRILSSDSTNTPTVATQRAGELVHSQGARAIITDSSQDDIAVNGLHYDADPANDLNVPIVCMACSSPAINNPASVDPTSASNENTLRNGLGWNFRTLMDTNAQARVAIRLWLGRGTNGDVNNDSQFKLGIFASDEAFGRGFAGALNTAAHTLHPSPSAVVETIYHPAKLDPNTYNWAADVNKLTDLYNEITMRNDFFPDVVMEVTFPQYAAAFLKSYLVAGQSVGLLHTHASRLSTALRALGALLNNHEGTSHVILDNGVSGDLFASEFKAQTGVAAQFLDSNTYDAAMAVMLATLVATKDLPDPTAVTGAQLRDALKHINEPTGTVIRTGPAEFARAAQLIASGQPINYEGASGPLDFDATQSVQDRIVHWRVENQQFVDEEKYDCVASPDCPLIK